MEVVVALSKCSRTKSMYGIRFEKRKRSWYYTWAFPVKEKSALREDYGQTRISGTMLEGEEYPGCPFCEAKNFFYCGCGKLNCWNGRSRTVTCAWCGMTGPLVDGIESINITSNM